MPIYEYECIKCGHVFESIEKASTDSWQKDSVRPRECAKCGKPSAYKRAVGFKIGSGILETTGKSGYETDELTFGKIVDDGGIPYEYKGKLRERQEMIDRTKQYTKELKERGKKYGFDPFSSADERPV